MGKKVKLLGKILFYTVFVAMLILVAGMVISKMTNKVFFIGNRAIVWVMTDSMEDEIPARSYIRIRKADPSEIKVGDVITFYSDDVALRGNLNTHRVVEITDGGKSFVTKGDNNLGNDKLPARAESVVGVYEKGLPVMTVMGRVFQSKIGFAVIIILAVLLTIWSLAWDPIKKMIKEKKKDSLSDEQK